LVTFDPPHPHTHTHTHFYKFINDLYGILHTHTHTHTSMAFFTHTHNIASNLNGLQL